MEGVDAEDEGHMTSELRVYGPNKIDGIYREL